MLKPQRPQKQGLSQTRNDTMRAYVLLHVMRLKPSEGTLVMPTFFSGERRRKGAPLRVTAVDLEMAGALESRRVSQPTPTELLLAWSRGEGHAFDQLVVLVNDELGRIARQHMRSEVH